MAILSNRLENLLLKLGETLFAKPQLCQKTIVVASRGMKRWMKGKLLASRGSFFGLTLQTLEEFRQGRVKKEEIAAQIYSRLPEIPEIASYLEKEEENGVFLAIHLASLFSSYQEIGFVPPKDHWQSKLFDLEPEKVVLPKGELYFFGFSYIPKPFLEQISSIPSYFLSPTLQFWEELKRDEHPLLGSLGRMGRVMARHLPQEMEKLFSLPEAIADHSAYQLTGEEFVEEGEITLLKALQADILLMREGEKISLSKDNTIEIHVAASMEREVEILKDRLFLLMGQEGVTPGEILVMAKDIAPYLPLLKAHFEKADLPFKVTYQEANMGSVSPLWHLLKELLHLQERRFQAEDILSFFKSEIVQKALSLSKDEIEDLETILEEGAIFWGWDKAEREKILLHGREHAGPSGSFVEGFERVWQKLLSFEGEKIPLNDPLPLSFAETLQAWILRLKALKEHIERPFKQSMKQWSLWLAKLIDLYLGESGELFDDLLNRLATKDETAVPFSFFYHFLEKGIEAIESTPGNSEWDAILFTSLGPMRAVPKRVIWLLGMEEEHFPSKEPPLFADLAAIHPDKISLRDQDRYAFLETILSSRERLMISYVTPLLVPPTAGEASLPVQELVSILDRNFLIDGKPFSEVGVTLHPRSRFNARPILSEVDYTLLLDESLQTAASKAFPVSKELKVKDLLIFCKDPAQTYFKTRFETSLPYFEAKLSAVEPFALSKNLKWAIDRQQLPPALTVSFAGRALEEGAAYHQEREAFIIGKKPFRVFFEKDCKKAMQDKEGNWVLPPLSIGHWSITGPLGLISEEGILIDGEVENHYPLLWLSQLLPFAVPSIFHCIDTKKSVSVVAEDPKMELEKFLEGYLAGVENPIKDKKSRYSELLA